MSEPTAVLGSCPLTGAGVLLCRTSDGKACFAEVKSRYGGYVTTLFMSDTALQAWLVANPVTSPTPVLVEEPELRNYHAVINAPGGAYLTTSFQTLEGLKWFLGLRSGKPTVEPGPRIEVREVVRPPDTSAAAAEADAGRELDEATADLAERVVHSQRGQRGARGVRG